MSDTLYMYNLEWKRKHIFNPDSAKGGVTLLYIVENHFGGFLIRYKYAVCSHKDNYDRKKGVLVATDKPVIECEIMAEHYSDVISAILHDIVSSPHGDGIKQPVKDIMGDYLRFKAHKRFSDELNSITFYFDRAE